MQFVIEKGCLTADVARELEINERPLGKWVNQSKENSPDPERVFSSLEFTRVTEMEDEISRLPPVVREYFTTAVRVHKALSEPIEHRRRKL